MDQGGYAFLLRFIESSHFTLFHCISYLERYSDEIGIHFHLCQKIRSYPSEDIEFFIPQLVQLHVTVQTESAALEDLIVDLCNRSTHCAVLIFWQVQAHLSELSDEPESYGFQGCQRLMAKLQHILFNVGVPPDPKIRENCSPGFVLAASVLGGVGMPGMVSHIKPLVVSQGRKRRTHIFQIANKLVPSRVPSLSSLRLSNSSAPSGLNRLQNNAYDEDEEQDLTLDSPISARSLSFSSSKIYHGEAESRSLPNLAIGSFRRASSMKSLRSVSTAKDNKKIEILKSNYFRCETQFMTALHTISSRLVSVPKQARLSALRIEIAMLNKDLPAEVDIPLLIPTARFSPADQPFPAQPKQHKLLRICPAEAVLLNSAERVPYLLLVEFLRNEVDFDPHSSTNKHLLTDEIDRRHIFDTLSTAHTPHLEDEELDNRVSNDDTLPPEEKDMGDISVINLYDNKRDIHTQESLSASVTSISRYSNLLSAEENSPRSSDLSFSPAYSLPIAGDEDISDIATHMRTAAVMITQLDGAGANKLPKEEVARIKAKIIASMQSMEEHTIYRTDIMAGEAGDRKMENDLKTTGMDDSREASNLNLGEEWLVRKERIRKASPFGHLPNWDLFSVIVKTGDDLRQEAFACQLIQAMQMCWKKAQTGVWVKQYNILITHNSAGLVETITNALSIHSIKKAMTTASVKAGKNPKGAIPSLREYFELVRALKKKLSFFNTNAMTDIWQRQEI
jgi:phosphatidylinositol 4-kinase